jgi:hypothetical protein
VLAAAVAREPVLGVLAEEVLPQAIRATAQPAIASVGAAGRSLRISPGG